MCIRGPTLEHQGCRYRVRWVHAGTVPAVPAAGSLQDSHPFTFMITTVCMLVEEYRWMLLLSLKSYILSLGILWGRKYTLADPALLIHNNKEIKNLGTKNVTLFFLLHTHKTPLKVNICLLQSIEVKREVLSSLFPQDLLECVCFCGGCLVVSLFTTVSQSPIFYWNISTGPPICWQADLLALGHWGELCSCRPDALLCLEKEERKRESEKKILNRLVQVILHAGIMKYKNAFKGLISYF